MASKNASYVLGQTISLYESEGIAIGDFDDYQLELVIDVARSLLMLDRVGRQRVAKGFNKYFEEH